MVVVFFGRMSPSRTRAHRNQRKPEIVFPSFGDSQEQDELIHERPDQPKWGFSPQVTDDGRFLILENWKGSEPQSQVFIKDLSDSTNSVKPLITGFDAEYIFVGSKENELYFLTDQKAPKRRLISLSADDVDRSTWQEVIPEGENVLESVSLFGESFYCQRLANASSEVVVHDLSGREKGEVELPGLGSVGGFVGAQDAEETFFRSPIMSLQQHLQSRFTLVNHLETTENRLDRCLC